MNCATERVLKALNHQEPDRIPTTDFFWPEFVAKWQAEKGLPPETDIYRFYDLDLVVVTPNIEPHLDTYQELERTEEHVLFLDGWGNKVKKVFTAPMPQYLEFAVSTPEEFKSYHFDSPAAPERFRNKRQNQESVGFVEEPAPSYLEDIEKYQRDHCLFGSVLDPYEAVWRMRGPAETLSDMVTEPEIFRKMAAAATDFMIAVGKEQIKQGKVSGLYIWGDLASNHGMLYSPRCHRELVLPLLKKMVIEFKKEGMKLIYHSDGDIREAIGLLLEAGIDGLDPLQPDVINVLELKEKYGARLSFVGNINLAQTREALEKEVLTKLAAARNGGYIISSGTSVGTDVSIGNYDYFMELIGEYGRYPLSEQKRAI